MTAAKVTGSLTRPSADHSMGLIEAVVDFLIAVFDSMIRKGIGAEYKGFVYN
jgi:hypothetical protein